MADDDQRRAAKFLWGPGSLRVVLADGRRVPLEEWVADRDPPENDDG